MKNMKGERCPYDNRVFCQEGRCEGCCIYDHYSTEKYKKWKEEDNAKRESEGF